MKLRDFIPPIVGKITHRRAPSTLTEYGSYEEALAHSDSYEAADIINVVARKTEIYRNQLVSSASPRIGNRQTLQNLFVLSHVWPERALHVVELGGACGANYFEMAHLLPGRIASWRIVETPAMAARARQAFQESTLSFYENLPEAVANAKCRDLLIAQGVLQYMPQPLEKFAELLALDFDWVYVSRTMTLNDDSQAEPMIVNSESRLSEHGCGPMPSGFVDRTITTPCTLFSGESFVARFPHTYRQQFWFDEDDPLLLTTNARVVEARSIGFLLRRTS
jgi:putative methyltransferase (TIGR04325 family)